MKNYSILIFLLAVVCLSSCSNDSSGIVYVDMPKIVYGYDGMKEAHAEYAKMEKASSYQRTPLKMKLDSLITAIKIEKSPKRKEIYNQRAYLINDQLNKMIKNQSAELEAKNAGLTDGVMNQIAAYTEEYAKEYGYELILGKKQDNILFGSSSKDISDELLVYLNSKYKGE